MSSLSQQEHLRHVIATQQERLRQTFPAESAAALAALTRARDWRFLQSPEPLHAAPAGAPPHHPSLFASGWQKALQVCLGAAAASSFQASFVPVSSLDAWADQMLLECDRLSAGEQVLAYCTTGFMRMGQGGQEQDVSVWIASKNMPTEWRARKDLTWWTQRLATTYERERQDLALEKAALQPLLDAFVSQWQADTPVYRTTPVLDDYYHRLGRLWVKGMACHLPYPAHTLIGDGTLERYEQVLAVVIGWAFKHLDLCRGWMVQHPSSGLRALLAPPQDATALIEALSATLRADRGAIGHAVDALSLSQENVSYHCAGAGLPAPPLLWLDKRQLVWSVAGLLSEPVLFLTRELRRRHSSAYHEASPAREAAFRQDLYALFADKRFVCSPTHIALKGALGTLTTDVDALIFDRKTGALALFELKAQDLFASSPQERLRQRDYFYSAGKQVLAHVQWLNRNGANALLARLDPQQVKRLKVQKTYIFVLGRYLAHFFDGPAFDRRAAWGTWPQVLRLVNTTAFGAADAHPIQSLYDKLTKDTPLALPHPLFEVQEIPIGACTVSVYPDVQSYTKGMG